MNEKIRQLLNDPRRIPVLIGVTAFAGGTAVGYFLGKKARYEEYEVPEQLALDFESLSHPRPTPLILDEEVYDALKEPYVSGDNKAEWVPLPSPITLSEPEEEPEEDPVLKNVFASDDDDWDYNKELDSRTPDAPYVLHKDEFFADEKGFTQITLMYYAGDDILADDADVPMYTHEATVGPLKFGHGSGDPNVFYVRNEKLKAEYEICNNPGLFSVEVMGLHIENNERARDLKHSVPRFRRED